MGLATGPAFRAISEMKKFWHQDHDDDCSGGRNDYDNAMNETEEDETEECD